MAALVLNLCTRRRSVTSCQLLLLYPCGTRPLILKRYMDPGSRFGRFGEQKSQEWNLLPLVV